MGLAKVFSFDRARMQKLFDICERETRVGKVANAILNSVFYLMRALKRARHTVAPAGWMSSSDRYPTLIATVSLPTHRSVAPAQSPFRRGVLIIADIGLPQCKTYRVDQKRDLLIAAGVPCEVASFLEPADCWRKLALYSTVVFYRTLAFAHVVQMMDECRRNGTFIAYDIDDLMFDADEYGCHPFLQTCEPSLAAELKRNGDLMRESMLLADHGIASTSVIASHMQKLMKKPVSVVHNVMPASLMHVARTWKVVAPHPSDPIVVGYGSGTKSHSEDFALLEKPLVGLLKRNPRVRIAIHGFLDLSETLLAFSDRIAFVPFFDEDTYFRAVGTFHVNVSPLVANTFNDAKSNIKFLEASALGVPTVASPRAEFRDAIRHGDNGFLAETDDEWLTCLTALVDNADLRARMGERARASALAEYGQETGLRELLASLFLTEKEQAATPNIFAVAAKELSDGLRTQIEAIGKEAHTEVLNVLPYEGAGFPNGAVLRDGNNFLVKTTPDPLEKAIVREACARLFARLQPRAVVLFDQSEFGQIFVDLATNHGVPISLVASDASILCARKDMRLPNGQHCGQTVVDPRVCASCIGDAKTAFAHVLGGRTLATRLRGVHASPEWRDVLAANGFGPLQSLSDCVSLPGEKA